MARHLTVVVRRVHQLTPDVTRYDLADPDDWPLPPFRAGAHVDVHLPNGLVRPFSLCSDPAAKTVWSIAVRHEPAGRGGSAFMQSGVQEGMTLSLSLPRNHFPLAQNVARHVFLAAGIGVTPFMAMIAALTGSGADFHLHMAARDEAHTPFHDEIAALIAQGRATLHLSGGGSSRRMPVAAIVDTERRSPGAHLYACGPERFLADFLTATVAMPTECVHLERFNAPAAATAVEGAPFDVELARSGRTVTVAPGQTILGAVRAIGVEVEASCEGGVCGACRTGVLAGEPDHRDFVMGPKDREQYMMICVGGAKTPRLVLDL